MAELNGLEPSSAWLTTKCLTSRPQFLKLAGMTRLEPANQLIENQPAFHFAFIPIGNSRAIVGAALRGRPSVECVRRGPRRAAPTITPVKYFDYQKTKGAGSSPPREAARSFNSLKFSLEI